MTAKRYTVVIFILVSCWATGCNCIPGKPSEAERWVAPSQVTNFDHLYAQNCAGCHGSDGRDGAALSLNNPNYLNLISPEYLRRVIKEGVSSTSMPAFWQKFGGQLTDAQVDSLADQMKSQWGNPDGFKAVSLPAYNEQDAIAAGTKPGDSQRGAAVYNIYCSECHGTDGRGSKTAGSIVDPNFLKLVSDQSLRTTIIVGRKNIGQPDCRVNADHPMSAQEVSDVVAWLSAQRPKTTAVGQAKPENRSSAEIEAAIAH